MDLPFNGSGELFNAPYCSPGVLEQNSTTEHHRFAKQLPGRVMLLIGMSLLLFFLFLIRRQVKKVEETYPVEESAMIPKKLGSQSEYFVSMQSTPRGDNLKTIKKKIANQDEMLKKLITLEIKLTELENMLVSKDGTKTPQN